MPEELQMHANCTLCPRTCRGIARRRLKGSVERMFEALQLNGAGQIRVVLSCTLRQCTTELTIVLTAMITCCS